MNKPLYMLDIFSLDVSNVSVVYYLVSFFRAHIVFQDVLQSPLMSLSIICSSFSFSIAGSKKAVKRFTWLYSKRPGELTILIIRS